MDEQACGQKFACKCLNVRLSARKTELRPPNLEYEKDFEPFFVGTDGITVAHTSLTLRIRSGLSTERKFSGEVYQVQRLNLLCLVCQIIVYRIPIPIGPEGAFKEGPILPTEEWMEQVAAYGQDGWIELHTGCSGCVPGERIPVIEASATFSTLYSIKLPEPPPGSLSNSSVPTHVPAPRMPSTGEGYMDVLGLLFRPPPFTPSHAVFTQLADKAIIQSRSIRAAAEQRIAEYIQNQIKQVAAAEGELKRQVQVLWRTFQMSVENVVEGGINIDASSAADNRVTREERPRPDHRRSSHSSHDSPRPNIRQFNPDNASPMRSYTPNIVGGPSALSSSLASSTFHHPTASQSETANVNFSEHITTNGGHHTPLSGSTLSPEEDSRRTSDVVNFTGSFKRNLNGEKDIAATLRYYDAEAEAAMDALEKANAGRGREQVASSSKGKENKEAAVNGRSERPSEKHETSSIISESLTKSDGTGSTAGSEKASSSKKKGKRKVTFDVEPAVVTITREIDYEKEKYNELVDINDTVFDFDENEDTSAAPLDLKEQSDLVFAREANQPTTDAVIEETAQRPSRRQFRTIDNLGLSGSFTSLRPASLPGPSFSRRPVQSISSSLIDTSRPLLNGHKEISTLSSKGKQKDDLSHIDYDHILQPFQEEIRKHVGADMPSHRVAWAPGSRSWSIFERRRKERHPSALSPSAIVEEGETSDFDGNRIVQEMLSEHAKTIGRSTGRNMSSSEWTHYKPPGVPSSLPISIGRLSRTVNEGVPVVQQKSSLTDREGETMPPLPMPQISYSLASSLRQLQLVSPEQERTRSFDPGPFDFIAHDDEEDDSLGSEAEAAMPASISQQQAMKIIQKRNEVPDAGMWRSLANS